MSTSVPNEVQVSMFAADTVEQALVEMRVRRRKLQPFLTEAEDLDFAIRETEKVLTKVQGRAKKRQPRQSTIRGGKPTNHNIRGEKKELILRALEGGQIMASAEIVKQTGVTGPYASQILTELASAGVIERVEWGKYRLNGAEASIAA